MLRQGVNFNEGADGYFQKAGVKAWGEQGCRGRGLSWKRENSMRRKDREVADFNEMIDIIKKCDVCRIALNDEGFPYIVPLNFGLDVQGEQVFLYFHAAMTGRKLDLIARDNRAAFEMDCGHKLVLYEEEMNCTMEYESVIGRGTIEMVPEEEKYEALKILMRQYHAEDFPFNTDMIRVTAVLKMTVTGMTGKRRNQCAQKDERDSTKAEATHGQHTNGDSGYESLYTISHRTDFSKGQPEDCENRSKKLLSGSFFGGMFSDGTGII